MHTLLAILILLSTFPPAPPIVDCNWPVSLEDRPVVQVTRHAPAHTTLTWTPAEGTVGVAVVAVSPGELRGVLDTDAVPAVVTVEDRQPAQGYRVYERRSSGRTGCTGVPLLAWNWIWLSLVVY